MSIVSPAWSAVVTYALAMPTPSPLPAAAGTFKSVVYALPRESEIEPIAPVSVPFAATKGTDTGAIRSEEHTSELQSRQYLVCRLLLEKKKKKRLIQTVHP